MKIKDNKFRFLALISVAIIFSLLPTKTYAKSKGFSANDIIRLTNEQRGDNNLGALKYNSKLEAAAYAKAQDMFSKNYWSHFSPQGVTPWSFIQNAGYSYSSAGENLAKGYSSSEAVIKGWLNSQKHRDNLLSSKYEEVGVAVVEGKLDGNNVILVVQMFGKPKVTVTIKTVIESIPSSINNLRAGLSFSI
jgi:uncharacterized protein YkwD